MWNIIEEVPGQTTLARIWRNLLGDDFERVGAFMRPLETPARRAPCGRCCCSHRIVPRDDGFIALCECEAFTCDDIPLTREDIVILQFDSVRLGRAVVRALGCEPREQTLDCGLRQVGIFGASALPVLLAVPHDPASMLQAVTQLVARLSSPFVLLAPTMRFVDVRALDLLDSCRAGAFGLDSIVAIEESGRVFARRSAGPLFSRFAATEPQKDAGVAEQAFALIEQLESGPKTQSPSVVSVFRLYCLENLTAEKVAERCQCSKGTIVNRLKTIRRVTGLSPEALRRGSNHLERRRDPRARRQFLDAS